MKIKIMARHDDPDCLNTTSPNLNTWCEFSGHDFTFNIPGVSENDFIAAFDEAVQKLRSEFNAVTDDMISDWIVDNWRNIVRDDDYIPNKVKLIAAVRNALPGRSLVDYKRCVDSNTPFMDFYNTYEAYRRCCNF